jgi:hypothetical protein
MHGVGEGTVPTLDVFGAADLTTVLSQHPHTGTPSPQTLYPCSHRCKQAYSNGLHHQPALCVASAAQPRPAVRTVRASPQHTVHCVRRAGRPQPAAAEAGAVLPSSAPRCVPALRSLLARSCRVGIFLHVSLRVCLFPTSSLSACHAVPTALLRATNWTSSQFTSSLSPHSSRKSMRTCSSGSFSSLWSPSQ